MHLHFIDFLFGSLHFAHNRPLLRVLHPSFNAALDTKVAGVLGKGATYKQTIHFKDFSEEIQMISLPFHLILPWTSPKTSKSTEISKRISGMPMGNMIDENLFSSSFHSFFSLIVVEDVFYFLFFPPFTFNYFNFKFKFVVLFAFLWSRFFFAVK